MSTINPTPGHYISLRRNATQADFFKPLSQPGVVGVQKRYVLRNLHPGCRRYALEELLSDVALADRFGGKLVAFIEDKTFTDERVLPDYLAQHEFGNRQGGYTAARWQGEIAATLQDLTAEIYKEVGNHPGFGGIALQESAPGLDSETLALSGYTVDAYVKSLGSARCDYLYLNYIPQGQDRLSEVIARTDAMVGGPDVLPDSQPLKDHFYPKFKKLPIWQRVFSSIQFDSYALDNWTLDLLIEWAIEELGVDTLFWNDKTWPEPAGSKTVLDAYRAIALKPVLYKGGNA